eukprot:8694715-Pyramimonas_sp.AAC.1
MGSAGQPAASDLDSGTDADASSDDEAAALDCSDMPTCPTKEQRAQWFVLGYQKHKRRWRRFMKKPARRVRRIVRRSVEGKARAEVKAKVSVGDYMVEAN